MKILLDEQLPVKLKYRFHQNFQVSTVRDLHWLGLKDQQLFSNMENEGFHLFITNDKNLKFQVNAVNLKFTFLDLNFFSNRYPDVINIMDQLNQELLLLETNAGSIGIYIMMEGRLKRWENVK